MLGHDEELVLETSVLPDVSMTELYYDVENNLEQYPLPPAAYCSLRRYHGDDPVLGKILEDPEFVEMHSSAKVSEFIDLSSPVGETRVHHIDDSDEAPFPLHQLEDNNHLLVMMVGLPARGKSYTAHRQARYMHWLGYKCKIFNLGTYRRRLSSTNRVLKRIIQKHTQEEGNNSSSTTGYSRGHSEYFNPMNAEARLERESVAVLSMHHIIEAFKGGLNASILDATNSSQKRRQMVLETVQRSGLRIEVQIVESVTDEDSLVKHNVDVNKVFNDDFKMQDKEEARGDFLKRLSFYEQVYETVEKEEAGTVHGVVKIIDVGLKMRTFNLRGYQLTRLFFYLSNIRVHKPPCYLVVVKENGQVADFNRDSCELPSDQRCPACRGRCMKSSLSSGLPLASEVYLSRVAKVLRRELDPDRKIALWSSVQPAAQSSMSVLRRQQQCPFDDQQHACLHSQPTAALPTVRNFEKNVSWRALRGINRGHQYNYISAPPSVDTQTLQYRWPNGESYRDLLERIERVVFELERSSISIVVIAQTSTAKCLMGYYLGYDVEHIPSLQVPTGAVIRLDSLSQGTLATAFQLVSSEENLCVCSMK